MPRSSRPSSTSRGTDADAGPLVDRLAEILAGDEPSTQARGEAVRVGLPEEEMLLARRRVERIVADAALSDPSGMDDQQLAAGGRDARPSEERQVSDARGDVIRVLDTLQDELKRRYKDDPSLALR